MNREIKFRAWDEEEKKMHYSDSKLDYGMWFSLDRGKVECLRNCAYADSFGDEHDDWQPLDNIMECTGLTAYWDTTENELQEREVWEHDLLEVEYNGKKVIAEVKFECGMYILASNEFVDSYIPLFDVVQIEDVGWLDAKVLGNIFENPELLELVS